MVSYHSSNKVQVSSLSPFVEILFVLQRPSQMSLSLDTYCLPSNWWALASPKDFSISPVLPCLSPWWPASCSLFGFLDSIYRKACDMWYHMICDIIQHLSVSVWLISSSVMPSRSICVVQVSWFPLFWSKYMYTYKYIYTHTSPLFIHLLISPTSKYWSSPAFSQWKLYFCLFCLEYFILLNLWIDIFH